MTLILQGIVIRIVRAPCPRGSFMNVNGLDVWNGDFSFGQKCYSNCKDRLAALSHRGDRYIVRWITARWKVYRPAWSIGYCINLGESRLYFTLLQIGLIRLLGHVIASRNIGTHSTLCLLFSLVPLDSSNEHDIDACEDRDS
jgi:hypothetical protein